MTRMLKLEYLNVVIGVVVGFIAIGGAIGSWYVQPYRLSQAEIKIEKLQVQLDVVRQENDKTRELLIRMDERIKTIQLALKIKTEP